MIDRAGAHIAHDTMQDGRAFDRDQSLDVVRGIAILLAMGWHLNAYTGLPLLDWLLQPGRSFGWAGVDLFFVLSGFLIGGIVLKEREVSGRFDAGRFLGRRAIRLWPVVWVFLAAQLVLADKSWTTFLFQNLLHVQNYWVSSISHLWSLAVEEHFYVILAVVFLLMNSLRDITRWMFWGLLGVIAIAPLLRAGGLLFGADYQALQWQTQYRVDALACGVLLSLVKLKWPDAFRALQKAWPLHVVIIGAGVAFLLLFEKDSELGATFGFTVAYLVSASLLLLIYKSEIIRRGGLFFRPLSLIGLYSYSMYVWHMAASNLAVKLAAKVGLVSPAIIVPLKYGAAIGVAMMAYYAVEKPVMRLRDKIFPAKVHVSV
ncbi:hypothetical protein ASC70_08020 [Caulobacter sp. Root343]|nr:hypothetical protein ASC62_08015 [Caulobacter sp. Root342]KQV68782.1 hypothetical protein ASC70_08020 [Caulobacter sp. Root343]